MKPGIELSHAERVPDDMNHAHLVRSPHGRRSEPSDASQAFRGFMGQIGGVCPCGAFQASGRTAEAMFAGLTEHQESPGCAWGAARRADELPDEVTATE